MRSSVGGPTSGPCTGYALILLLNVDGSLKQSIPIVPGLQSLGVVLSDKDQFGSAVSIGIGIVCVRARGFLVAIVQAISPIIPSQLHSTERHIATAIGITRYATVGQVFATRPAANIIPEDNRSGRRIETPTFSGNRHRSGDRVSDNNLEGISFSNLAERIDMNL